MARLFIFGNGYDIAHNIVDDEENMLTEYKSFKRWLIRNIIKIKEPDFDENSINLTEVFNDVNWIEDEFIYREWYQLNKEESKRLSFSETEAAQFAFAKVIVWFFKCIERKMNNSNTWEDFEINLGNLQEPIRELIESTGINDEESFNIQKVSRIMNELKILWKDWIVSIKLPDSLTKNEYDTNIVKEFNSNDIVISTNYTETFESLFKDNGNVFHIHGDRRNTDDELIVGHGKKSYNDFSKAYDDMTVDQVIYTVEYSLYKNVERIIEEKEEIFTKIKELFGNDKESEIYSCGFSFSDVDKGYIEYIKHIIGNSYKVKWHLSKYDQTSELKQIETRGETYKTYLERIGFDVDYVDY